MLQSQNSYQYTNLRIFGLRYIYIWWCLVQWNLWAWFNITEANLNRKIWRNTSHNIYQIVFKKVFTCQWFPLSPLVWWLLEKYDESENLFFFLSFCAIKNHLKIASNFSESSSSDPRMIKVGKDRLDLQVHLSAYPTISLWATSTLPVSTSKDCDFMSGGFLLGQHEWSIVRR